ncbi:PPOX class F420-dependent oxidoreductase [Streptomyces sp. GSL17-111]|uniref:PPOX class F420-dependent oxidoreductase n=1 Tax=Streptomyces sp. GSL17-111 TaxID=3121596 RepID=UPI0030F47113
MSEVAWEALLRRGRLGVLATVKRDGRPQLSNVNYAFGGDEQVVRVSATEGRAKVRNLRRDPRASLHVMSEDGREWAVAEGDVELSDVAAEPHDAVVEELVESFRAVQGERPDWAEYRAAMVADRRLVVRLRVARVYGQGPG